VKADSSRQTIAARTIPPIVWENEHCDADQHLIISPEEM
jgi:hypothetical protein